MKYLKSLIFAFKEIFIMFILQYAVLIACIVCLGKDRSIVIGTILVCAVEILYVIFKLRNGKPAIGKHNLFPYALMGIGITTSYNMLLFAMARGHFRTHGCTRGRRSRPSCENCAAWMGDMRGTFRKYYLCFLG